MELYPCGAEQPCPPAHSDSATSSGATSEKAKDSVGLQKKNKKEREEEGGVLVP